MEGSLDRIGIDRSPLASVSRHALPAGCVMSIVIPARDEEGEILACLRALRAQRSLDGQPLSPGLFEVVLLANNCTDRTAALARAFGQANADFALRVIEHDFPADCAHVGTARGDLMDAAAEAFLEAGQPQGIIATTDADTLVAPDWVAQTLRECQSHGHDAVGGFLLPRAESFALLEPAVRAFCRMDLEYKLRLERYEDFLRPHLTDPWPRHFFHNGASLAVTAGMYRQIGGLPRLPAHEDQVLYQRLCRAGASFRHSFNVRVRTSARRSGRTTFGMAATLNAWTAEAETGEVLGWGESLERIAQRVLWPHRPALAGGRLEIQEALQRLRQALPGMPSPRRWPVRVRHGRPTAARPTNDGPSCTPAQVTQRF